MFNDTLIKTAKALTAYCQVSDEATAIKTLYAHDCVSIEAFNMPDTPIAQKTEGRDAIRAKQAWWASNGELHESRVEGPYLHGDRHFSIVFYMDVTDGKSQQRVQMKDIGFYTINSDGLIIREEFHHPPMS